MNPTELKEWFYLWIMANNNRNILPKIWVWLSMLALAFFLGYWNYSNYQSEKKQLQQTLANHLQIAYTEVMDSVFVEEIIVMTKINGFDIDLQSNTIQLGEHLTHAVNDTFHKKLKFVDLKERPDFIDTFKIITSSDELNEKADVTKKSDTLSFTFSPSDTTHFNKSDILNTDHLSLMIEGMFTAKVDHKPEIINVFKKKIDQLNYPSTFHIDSIPAKSSLPVYYKGDRQYDIPVHLEITDHTPYLLKSILPSLLFSMALFSIVGLAFWTLLSNWSKQQKLIEIKNEFISNMTHELKTPISTVGVALEAIAGFDLSKEEEKTKEYVDISRHELNRLSLLVDKVLKMASFEGSYQVMKKESIHIANTTESIIKSMKLHLEEKNAIVNYHNTTLNSEIDGDTVHITNVIYNIMDNALKYSETNPVLDINLSEDGKNVILRISDHGIGIPSEYIDKVFDRFFRVPTSDRHNVKGHGLGLSYVKDVITKHGGHIKAESKIGEGTTFVITLPKSVSHV